MSINGIPKNERVWVDAIKESGNRYLITSKINDRSTYFAYQVLDGKAVKLGKNSNPKTLEEKYFK